LGGQIRRLKSKTIEVCGESSAGLQTGHEDILNPDIVRSKGCSAFSNETPSMHRAPRSCGICCIVGHNKRSCPQTNVNYVSGNTQSPMPTIKATNGSEYSFDLNN
jgi:hypothetical protein